MICGREKKSKWTEESKKEKAKTDVDNWVARPSTIKLLYVPVTCAGG